MSKKPSLLLIRPSLEKLSPHFIDSGFLNRERGLGLYFNVKHIEENFDMKKLIHENSPDIIIFMYDPCSQGGMLKLSNADYDLNIPRLLIPIFDAYSLYRWNVYLTYKQTYSSAIFTYDTSLGQYYPFLAKFTFQWHEFIDCNIFKNYNLGKTHNILLTGSFRAMNYPWRRSVLIKLKRFSPKELTHWNRDKPNEGKRSLVKEEFSKQINSAKIAPTCGGHSRIILGKHFEIPGSYTCLVTEKTEALIRFGYKDGENCVFADESNIEEKINELLNDSERLQTITKNGYEFIRQNHTAVNRTEIKDWYDLYKIKKSSEKIIQSNVLNSLKIVNIENPEENFFVNDVPPVNNLVEIDKHLIKGDIRGVEDVFKYFESIDKDAANSCIRYAILFLLQNKIKKGINCFSKIVDHELEIGKNAIIDPVELFIFCCLLYKKEKYNDVIDLTLYSNDYLHNINSRSIHLDIIHHLACQKLNIGNKKTVSLSNYTFVSSHELLNISIEEIKSFLARCFRRDENNIQDIFYNTVTNEITLLESNKKPFVGNVSAYFNKYIYAPSFIEKIKFKLKRLFIYDKGF